MITVLYLKVQNHKNKIPVYRNNCTTNLFHKWVSDNTPTLSHSFPNTRTLHIVLDVKDAKFREFSIKPPWVQFSTRARAMFCFCSKLVILPTTFRFTPLEVGHIYTCNSSSIASVKHIDRSFIRTGISIIPHTWQQSSYHKHKWSLSCSRFRADCRTHWW